MATEKTLLAKAKALNKTRQYQQVVDLLTDALLEQHRDADLYAEKAAAYYRLDDKKQTERLVEKALLLNPEQASALHFKGNLEADNKRYDEAIAYYNKALKIDPDFELPYIGLGSIYEEQKKYPQAIVNYNKAIALNPSFDFAYANLGNIYEAYNESGKAVEYYRKAIKVNPRNEDAYNGLGIIYYNNGENDKAEKQYKKALQINPKHAYVYNNLSLVYQNKKEYQKAVDCLTKAIEIKSDYASAFYNRASLYRDNKEYAKAKADYEQFIGLKKDKDDYNVSIANAEIAELQKLIVDAGYSRIVELVGNIKKLLLFTDANITHYTSFSAAKILVLGADSKFRLSEGAFLNDTSEGRELFAYLDFDTATSKKQLALSVLFNQKPFIGSFVSASKFNDLTLWRMYGKEEKEEAKGCAITINPALLVEALKKQLMPSGQNSVTPKDNEAFSFYKVAYRAQDGQFILPGSQERDVQTLNGYMQALREKVKEVLTKDTTTAEDRQNILLRLNEIAYLFKTDEYQHEQELRLVLSGVGFDKKVDIGAAMPRVFIELVNIRAIIQKITIGPKVDRADEWAAAFHYSLDKDGLRPEICISHLPYK